MCLQGQHKPCVTLDASSEPGHHVRLPSLPSEMFVIQVIPPNLDPSLK